MAVDGNLAFVADHYDGLVAVDVSDPSAPTALGTYPIWGAHNVRVAQGIAYVGGGWEGLFSLDVRDPALMARIALHDSPGWTSNSWLGSGRVYVADEMGGLTILGGCTDYLFADGFESGSVSRWSSTVP